MVIAANILLDGGVICIPTDTVYGISCIADDVSAVSKVFRLKNRSEGVPLRIFISSLEEIDQFRFSEKISDTAITRDAEIATTLLP